MTFKEYFTQTRDSLKDVDKLADKLEKIFRAPSKAWIPGYKENQATQEQLRTFYYYHKEDPENLLYYTGDKLATLEDIKQNRLEAVRNCLPDSIEPINIDEWSENEMSAGYAGFEHLKSIESFWENVDDDDIMRVVSGEDADDYPLDGWRNYLLSGGRFRAMLYSYVTYTMKKTQKELDDNLCNSNEVHDEFDSIRVPENPVIYTPAKLEAAYEIALAMENHSDVERFNHMIENIKDCFGENSFFKERVEAISEQAIKV